MSTEKNLKDKAPATSTAPAKDEFLNDLNQPVAVIPAEMTGVSRADAFAMMENASSEQLQNLNSEYFKLLNKGDRAVMLFTGMTTFKGDKGEVEAVFLEDKDGRTFICPTAVIVSALKKVTELPAYCRLTLNGKKENSKRQQYDDYTVEVFPGQAK